MILFEKIHMFNRSKDHNDYSRLVVLVCNKPDGDNLNNHEQKIIDGLKFRWRHEQDDQNMERIHIIFIDRDDCPTDKKFSPLRKLNNLSKIYIVGHCSPGSDVIKSEPIYRHPCYPYGELSAHGFSYHFFALILKSNITHQRIISNRTEAYDLIKRKDRKLKICVTACNSAVSAKIDDKLEQSFTEKLFNILYNQSGDIINCDIVGVNGLVAPIGAKQGMINAMKFIADKSTEIGFNKRYTQTLQNGSMNIFSHQPNNEYKITRIVEPTTTIDDVSDGKIRSKCLYVAEAKQHLENQQIMSDIELLMAVYNYRYH